MGSDLGATKKQRKTSIVGYAIAFVAGFLFHRVLVVSSDPATASPSSSSLLRSASSGCSISFGPYKGPRYRSASSTIGETKCLIESKFLQISQHRVQLQPNQPIIDDWLWIDYHDRINVLVMSGDRQFSVFQQTKYALEDRQSLAIVGGIIEPHELPEHAARREVEEELQLHCQTFQFLGRYRTDVNRGMGWTNTYLASECQRRRGMGDEAMNPSEEVGAPDTERQDLRVISLDALKEGVRNGKFLEIQWTATIALAILHLESKQNESHSQSRD